ncbi:reverse transcriptase family protein [Stratiformator vulcanicus]|uniref:RNA-directed DNA polymerase n=1 Tax=Stratiformator vulcanicus TaxID=2527980 RepID=A0A517R2M6_9PLAN|nr:reverse transcriptase family protein [Stratiformator vulcanicus]QDT38111.1 Reverse transcriptase (RNA-dependent DNA polymerase) [Stratiformator vulcanicus]
MFRWLLRLLFGEDESVTQRSQPEKIAPVETDEAPKVRVRPRLARFEFRRRRGHHSTSAATRTTEKPYRFALPNGVSGETIDRSQDQNFERLTRWELPALTTPEDLADWMEVSIGELAWLTHRTESAYRPPSLEAAHYHFRWVHKKSGGSRLIESPKRRLKHVQQLLLRGLLDRVPAHPAAHGFVRGRSIVSNAQPHVGKAVVLSYDLENFYPAVRYNRVVAVFRGLGYSREAAIWLTRLTTSALPPRMPLPEGRGANLIRAYAARHLPQGAPTSPALANLSAFSLDVRLNGLANSFEANYTRYADDLTFSGDDRFRRSLATFIPLVNQIVRSEQFVVHREKRKVVKHGQRQLVTGVVVNDRPNVSRAAYDRLKATLHNCVRQGPASQNRDEHLNFEAHLQGKISHVRQLNPARAEKLQRLFDRIEW